MRRRFELADQYYEIDVQAESVKLRRGVGDRLPQTIDRGFATTLEAARFAEQQIAGLLAKGYAEVGAPAPPPESTVTVERTLRFQRVHVNRRFFLVLAQRGRELVRESGTIVDEVDVPDPAQRTARRHGTVALASAAFDEAVRDAEYDGWKLPAPVRTYAIHTNPALEAECLAHDDPAAWQVYADWLIAAGDPRGEIASLALAGKRPEAERVLAANLHALCPDHTDGFAFELRHGFVRGATIRRPPDGELEDPDRASLAAITTAFLRAPLGRFVDALRFGLAAFSDRNDWTPALRAVIESEQAPRLRELRFDAYTSEDCEISWTPYGDFTGLLAELPALELLHIKSGAGGTLGALDLPNLRTFIRESGGLARAEIEAICAARWPRLEHLELWFGSRTYGAEGSLPAIRSILDAEGLPALGHLGIVNAEFVEDAIDGLAHSKLLPQLHSLDLSRGVMDRRGARAFVTHAARSATSPRSISARTS